MRRLLGLLLLTLVFAAACSDDPSGPDARIEGTYTLRTINGQNIPFVLEEGTIKFEWLSSTLTISQAGTFTDVTRTRTTIDGDVSDEEVTTNGIVTRSGNNLTLTASNGVSLNGVWNGDDQLTFTEVDEEVGTFVYVFRK